MSIVAKLKLKCDVNGLNIHDCIEAISLEILNNVYLPNSKSMANMAGKVARIKDLCEA